MKRGAPTKITSFRLHPEDERRMSLFVDAVQDHLDRQAEGLPDEYRRRVTNSDAFRYFLEQWEQGRPLPRARREARS